MASIVFGGRDNRMKVDRSGSISRHTSGSMSIVFVWKLNWAKNPTFEQLFLHTHLKKESKAKYWVGFYDDNPEGMEFCTNRSKEAYESYSIYMVEKYDEDETQHPIGDIDLWERSQGEKKQSFGIGSSDRHFILTGTPSSSIRSTPSNVMFEQSQQEVRELRSWIHELQSQVDTQKEQMIEEIKKERDQMREEIMEERKQIKEDMRAEMQQQMTKFFKQMGIPAGYPRS